jgi:hypothetical protein
MKKLLLIPLLVLIAGLYSCNKTNSITKSNNAAIVGKWAPSEERDQVYTTTGTLVLDTTYKLAQSTDTSYYYETFTSNNTAYVTKASTGATLESFTYKITADELALYQNGNTSDLIYFSILNLTSSNLVLQDNFSATPGPGTSLSTTTVYDFTASVYYTKQ